MAVVIDQAPRKVCVLPLEGPLRVPLTFDLPANVQALVNAGERNLVVDLTAVPTIDAAGIGELIRAYRLANVMGGGLRIAHPNRQVGETLQRVGLFELLAETGP